MTIRIRPMRLADIAAVLPLERELFAGDPPWTAEIFRSELAEMPATRWYIVAESIETNPTTSETATAAVTDTETATTTRRVVGYAGVRLPAMSDEPADLYTIAVAADQQRHGIGSRLLRVLVDEARAADAGSLMLDVRVDNDAGRAFYTGHGFEQIGLRRGYFGGGRDGLVMSLPRTGFPRARA